MGIQIMNFDKSGMEKNVDFTLTDDRLAFIMTCKTENKLMMVAERKKCIKNLSAYSILDKNFS